MAKPLRSMEALLVAKLPDETGWQYRRAQSFGWRYDFDDEKLHASASQFPNGWCRSRRVPLQPPGFHLTNSCRP